MAKVLNVNFNLTDDDLYFMSEEKARKLPRRDRQRYLLIKEYKRKVDDLFDWVDENRDKLLFDDEYGDFYQWLLYHFKTI